MFDDIRARPLASAPLLRQLDYLEAFSRPLTEDVVTLALDVQHRAYQQSDWYQWLSEPIRYQPEIWFALGLALLRSSYGRDETFSRALDDERWREHEKVFRHFFTTDVVFTAALIADVNKAVKIDPDFSNGEAALYRDFIVRNWQMGVAKRLIGDAVEQSDEVFDGGGDVPTMSLAFIQAYLSDRVHYEGYRVTDAGLRTGMPDALIPCLPAWHKRPGAEAWVYAPREIGALISDFESSTYRSTVHPHLDRPTIRIALHAIGLTQHDSVPRLRAELRHVRDDGSKLIEVVKKRGDDYGITNRAGSTFNATGASPEACQKAAKDARTAKRRGDATGPQWWQKPTKAQSADRIDRWTRWFAFLADRGLAPASLVGGGK